MSRPSAVFLVITSWIWVAGCGSSPTRPDGPRDITGQWSGTTAQGAPISFTVSADERVTAISVGYNFNGCSGTQTFSNLNVPTAPEVICIPGPCSPTTSAYRAFSYSVGPRDGPATSVNGLFLVGTAEGRADFMNYPNCGSALAIPWTATKR